MRRSLRMAAGALALAGMFMVAGATAQPGPPWGRAGGWGPHGRWGRHWNPSTVVTLSGTVVVVSRITPYSGMSEGVHVTLRTSDGTISVHLGPAWFLDRQDLTLKKGDRISVRGSRIAFSGKPALLAAEIHRGSDTLLLRDEDGYPFWAAWRARGASSR